MTTPRKPGPAPVRTVRPPKGGLSAALDAASAFRPAHVPEDATLLVSWVNLPGENTQRSKHWAQNKVWKDRLKADFTACLNHQGHPGLYDDPAVHVSLHVSRKGDANNQLSRAKFVLDLLQVHRVRVDGVRLGGLLDLIEDDSLLTDANRTIEEAAVGAPDTGRLDRKGRRIREGRHQVMVWVWNAHG